MKPDRVVAIEPGAAATEHKSGVSERSLPSRADHDESWLETLLALANSLPVDEGLEVPTTMCIDAVARLLPNCAVGACVVSSADTGRIVEVRLPPDLDTSQGSDPTRLFPTARYERIFPLSADGSTLHVASNLVALDAAECLQARIAGSAAAILSATIRRWGAFASAVRANEDLQRLQAHVIQAEKLASLGQIVAGVVHELNNPLTSIVAYSDYLRKKGTRDEDDAERLRRIGEAAERILKFSRDLVAYARPTSHVPASVELHEVIDKALIFCEHEFTESQVEVVRQFGRLPYVRGIAGQLTQVFVNLFTNAAHAMQGRGGRLLVRSALEGAELARVDVCDQGVGISPEDVERIFDPFFTTKTDGRGTGLGLSIVKEIVSGHGGTLSASSQLGVGTTFTLRLPLAARPPSSTPPKQV